MKDLVVGSGVTRITNIDGTTTYQIAGSDILYSNVAFVDPIYGNDGTGQYGRFNKPYQSITTAMSAVAPFANSSTPSLVILRKGDYYSTFYMQDNVHVYCEPGVTMYGTIYGHNITSGQSSKFFGHAQIRSYWWAFLMDSTGGRLDIEFDNIDAAGFIITSRSSIVRIKCNWARISGANGGGYCFRTGDDADVMLDVREYFHGQHSLFFLGTGVQGIPFRGKLTVNCPKMEIITPYTGNYGNVNTAILQTTPCGACRVVINGECRIDRPNTWPAFVFQNHYIAPSIIEINGDVYATSHCIYTGYVGWLVDIRVNGDLVSNISPINCYLNNTNSDPGPSYITVRDSKIIGYANILGVSRYIKFMNCSFYNYADGVTYPTAPNITWQNDQLGQIKRADFYNCIAQANGASSEFMEFAGTGLTEITIVGCYGNKPVGTGLVPVFSDYVQVPNLKSLNRV
jgi:hypothetical protein